MFSESKIFVKICARNIVFIIMVGILPAQVVRNALNRNEKYSSSVIFYPNNIRTTFTNNGNVFTSTKLYGFENNSLMFSSGLWVVGMDETKKLRVSISNYQSFYQPGRIHGAFTDTNYSAADDITDPRYKILLLSDTSTVVDSQYQLWVSNASLTGAPLDNNGKPLLRGSLNAYWIMNDLDTTKSRSFLSHAPTPMGLEIQNYFFATKGNTSFENTIFAVMDIRNKSTHSYTSTYLGWWSDIDLGDPNNNYDGCDTLLSLAYMYTGIEPDAVFGRKSPACGFAILESPTFISDGKGMTSFTKFFKNTQYQLPRWGDANSDSQTLNVLSGKLITGLPITLPDDSNHSITYVNPGDPVSGTGWVASQDGLPRDNNFVQGSGPFTFAPNQTVRFVVAFIVAHDSDRFSSLKKLKETVPIVQSKWNSILSMGRNQQVQTTPLNYSLLNAYPNPFNPTTTINFALSKPGNIILKVYNVLGKEVVTLVNEFKETGYYSVKFDASKLSSGLYIYKLTSGKFSQAKKILLLK